MRLVLCSIKNEFAIGAMGELSPMDVLPEVWILDNEWLTKAQQIIAEFNQPVHTSSWNCSKCQEHNEASFELCWQCGTNRVIES